MPVVRIGVDGLRGTAGFLLPATPKVAKWLNAAVAISAGQAGLPVLGTVVYA